MIYTLTIPDWIPSSVNRLMSRVSARIRGKQEDRLIVFAAASHTDIPTAIVKRRVSVHMIAPGRLPDPDNVLKSLLDSLVAARLLVDDNALWMELGQVKVERGPKRQTVITLEDLVAGDVAV
jgi:Holliday junction resolvase RusA-like endonuclease